MNMFVISHATVVECSMEYVKYIRVCIIVWVGGCLRSFVQTNVSIVKALGGCVAIIRCFHQ